METQKWKIYRFPEFVEINPAIRLEKDQEYSFIEMKDLDPNNRNAYPSAKRKLSGGTRFQNRDTLFARITPCLENGKICQAKGLDENVGFGSTEFLVFRGKPGISNTDFVFYLSRSESVRKFAVQNLVGTSGRQRVGKEAFDNLEIEVPDLPTQQKIASILSSLDDKIELNRQTNATLEAMAQALFQEWFVAFNFPGATGEMEDSEMGLVPKGWRVEPLEQLGEFKNGINYSRDEVGDTEYSIINVRNIVENKFIMEETLDTVKIDRKKADAYLLTKNDIIIVRSASPGESGIMLKNAEDVIYSGFTIRFRLYEKSYFTYFFFIIQSIKRNLDSLSNGTTLKNINQEMLKSYKTTLPPNELVLLFNSTITPILEEILTLQKQCQVLSSMRDKLIPQLINRHN